MKLVMTWMVLSGPNSWDITHTLEYESIEKAEYDFLTLCEERKDNTYPLESKFIFAGHLFDALEFYYWSEISVKHARKSSNPPEQERKYIEPRFQTLEDWFNKNLGTL